MSLENWLQLSVATLTEAGISTARLDTLVLLEDITGMNRAHLLAHLESKLTETQITTLNKLIERRATHEPLAYLRNKTEFYGREFYIDHRVLEPRPESEMIIEILKTKLPPATPTIIDIGTGSGMLAITAKLEFPAVQVIATDIDPGCLAVTKRNATAYKTTLSLLLADLLQKFTKKTLDDSVILANLPYVPDGFQINPAAMAEPRTAIFGGSDGLAVYRKLFAQLQHIGARPSYVLTEAMPPQHEELTNIAQAAGFALEIADDFIQAFRPS